MTPRRDGVSHRIYLTQNCFDDTIYLINKAHEGVAGG